MPATPTFSYVSGTIPCGSVSGNTLTVDGFCNTVWRLNYRGTLNIVATYSNCDPANDGDSATINGYEVIQGYDGAVSDSLGSFNQLSNITFTANTANGSGKNVTRYVTFTPIVSYPHTVSYGYTALEACSSEDTFTLYSEDETLTSGSILYYDQELLNSINNELKYLKGNFDRFMKPNFEKFYKISLLSFLENRANSTQEMSQERMLQL
jgi:hypothetical protein